MNDIQEVIREEKNKGAGISWRAKVAPPAPGRSTGGTSRWKRWLAHCSGKTFAEHIHLSLLSGNHSFVGLLLCGATHPVQISSHLNVLCLLDILCLKFHTPIVKEQFCFCENLEFNWENNMNLMNIFIHSH